MKSQDPDTFPPFSKGGVHCMPPSPPPFSKQRGAGGILNPTRHQTDLCCTILILCNSNAFECNWCSSNCFHDPRPISPFHRRVAVFCETVTKIVSCLRQMPCDRPGRHPPPSATMHGSMHRKTQPRFLLYMIWQGQFPIRHHFCSIPSGIDWKQV